MPGRVYEAAFNNQTFTNAVHDIFSLQPGASMALKLLEIVIGQVTVATTEALQLTFRRFSSGFTIGSGGSAITPSKHVNGDVAAATVARCNDTTQTTGSFVVVRADVFNEVNGYQYLAIPDKEIIIPPGQCLVISMDSAPAASRVLNSAATFEEML